MVQDGSWFESRQCHFEKRTWRNRGFVHYIKISFNSPSRFNLNLIFKLYFKLHLRLNIFSCLEYNPVHGDKSLHIISINLTVSSSLIANKLKYQLEKKSTRQNEPTNHNTRHNMHYNFININFFHKKKKKMNFSEHVEAGNSNHNYNNMSLCARLQVEDLIYLNLLHLSFGWKKVSRKKRRKGSIARDFITSSAALQPSNTSVWDVYF